MGNNNSSGNGVTSAPPSSTLSSSGQRGGFLGAFLSGQRLDFTLANMRQLHAQLKRFAQLPDAEIVELLRVLSEFLIYSDQHRVSIEADGVAAADVTPGAQGAGAFFDYFGETNILGLLVQLGASTPSVDVQVQLLQTMSILVQNIATRTSLYYILSNNHVNRLLECPFAIESDDDVRDWYVTLLKALSLRLNEETVQFFYDTQQDSFPLYSRALRFGRCTETMVKVAVKTLTLNVLRVPDDRVHRFILQHDDLNYFRDIVELANDLTLKLQGLLNGWAPSAPNSMQAEKLGEAVDEYMDHCFYLQDLLDVNMPELCYKVGDLLFSRHVKWLLATSVPPDCAPPPQRVSTRLALYLLTRLLGIMEHTPLVNAIAFMLLSPDATEDCEYSAVALGAGSRRSHQHSPRCSKHKLSVDGSRNDIVEPTSTAGGVRDGEEATSQTLASPLLREPSLRWDKEAPPTHVFRPHSTTACDSPLCYLQTRFDMGEWPVDEVKAFVPSGGNCYRQALLTLLKSSDERLSSTAMLLLVAIVNNQALDHSLLRELNLLPFRHNRPKRSNHEHEAVRNPVGSFGRQRSRSAESDGHQRGSAKQQANGDEEGNAGAKHSALPSTASLSSSSSSSCSSSSASQGPRGEGEEHDADTAEGGDGGVSAETIESEADADADTETLESPLSEIAEAEETEVDEAKGAASSSSCSMCLADAYPAWLVDSLLAVVARNQSTRLLSVQVCSRLLVDIMVDARNPTPHHLTQQHAVALKDAHSSSAHLVMESMRGAMSDVDLFIYVLEDEVRAFQRARFPMELNLQSSSPFEYLVPLDGGNEPNEFPMRAGGTRDTLALRDPANDMEVCRKSMRVFLVLRKLRELLDANYEDDELEQLVLYRHPRTSVLADAAADDGPTSATAPLDGMVTLKCMWRKQRFLLIPTRLRMVLNPEVLVLVERVPEPNEDSSPRAEGQGEATVKLFVPIHRAYSTLDTRDDRVLHVSVASATSVPGCRSSRKEKKRSREPGSLATWNVSLLFTTAEDCVQAQEHINLSCTEVRAFKLRHIEESLTKHMQVTHSSNSIGDRRDSIFVGDVDTEQVGGGEAQDEQQEEDGEEEREAAEEDEQKCN